jgi:anti-anti-sigma regulatory factor
MSRHLTLATNGESIPSPLQWSPPRPIDLEWHHTLVLTGRLDGSSAPELEEEIECLCQEGVTHLTVDLRALDTVDASGVRAIAFGNLVCRRRGNGYAVITGSFAAQRALTGAGVSDSLVWAGAPAWQQDWGGRTSAASDQGLETRLVRQL